MVRGEWDRTQKPPRPKEAPTFVRSLGDAHRLPDEVVIPPPAPPAHAAAAEAAALACGEGGGGRGGGSGQAEPPLGDILLPSGTPPQRSPAPLGCIGLVIRGLMGVKPATVKLVTSRGCKKGEKKGAGELGGGGLQPAPKQLGGCPQRAPTLEPPARTRCRVLQTNMPPFSTSFLQCRKAKPRKRCRISPSRPWDGQRGEGVRSRGGTGPSPSTRKAPRCQKQPERPPVNPANPAGPRQAS